MIITFLLKNFPQDNLDETPRAPKVAQKRSRDVDITPNPKSRRNRVAMRSLALTNVTPTSKGVQDRQAESLAYSFDPEDPMVKSQSCGKPTRCVDLSSRSTFMAY